MAAPLYRVMLTGRCGGPPFYVLIVLLVLLVAVQLVRFEIGFKIFFLHYIYNAVKHSDTIASLTHIEVHTMLIGIVDINNRKNLVGVWRDEAHLRQDMPSAAINVPSEGMTACGYGGDCPVVFEVDVTEIINDDERPIYYFGTDGFVVIDASSAPGFVGGDED